MDSRWRDCLEEKQHGARQVAVDAQRAGQRLDNFLSGQLKGLPKGRLYRMIRQGEVRVNRRRAGPDYRLQEGDVVRVPPAVLPGQAVIAPSAAYLDVLKAAILYDDEQMLVLNKPAGMAVHAGSGTPFGIIEAMSRQYPGQQLGLAHRLDRETSGCLVLAKNPAYLRHLHKVFRHGQADKRYLALVRGHWPRQRREVAVALDTQARLDGERTVKVSAQGKQALTYFEVLAQHRGASLVQATLATGRTHQIRVHAAYVGHPVAGDERYGDTGFNEFMSKLGLRRLFLHASYLAIPNDAGKSMQFRAPLPPELDAVVSKLPADQGNG